MTFEMKLLANPCRIPTGRAKLHSYVSVHLDLHYLKTVQLFLEFIKQMQSNIVAVWSSHLLQQLQPTTLKQIPTFMSTGNNRTWSEVTQSIKPQVG